MNHADLETTYESLARKLDEIGETNSELFLAKLVLLLAHTNGDANQVQQLIDEAAATLSAEGNETKST